MRDDKAIWALVMTFIERSVDKFDNPLFKTIQNLLVKNERLVANGTQLSILTLGSKAILNVTLLADSNM